MVGSQAISTFQDHSADTLERCWVVFEAALAHELGKAAMRPDIPNWMGINHHTSP